jgi:uncharacterized protein (DUF58 family)
MANASAIAIQSSERAIALASALPPMLVKAEKIAASMILGVHGRKRSGPGESFWQYRPYTFGDSTQRIDWRRSAVSGRTFIRENEWEAANTLWLWANTNARMNFKSALGLETKRDRAVLLMLAMASLSSRAHERVGGIGSGRAASHGRSAVMRLAQWCATENPESLPWAGALQKNAAAILFSDFLDEPAAVAHAIGSLAERGLRGHLVMLADPAEETLPYDGRVEFLGLDKPLRYLSPKTENLRAAYIEKYQAHRNAVQEIARSVGWSFQVHRTDHSAMPTLLALYSKVSDANTARTKGGKA